MGRFLEHFRAIKQSSSQQTKKIFFWVHSTKTRKSNFQMEGFFWLKIENSFNKKRSYTPLVLGLEGDGPQF